MSSNDPDANKELVRGFIDAWNERDFGRFDTLMADDAVLHVGGTTVSCSPSSTSAIAQEWTTAFPDWRFELVDLIAEGDRVVAHVPYTGTFAKSILGIPPTGRTARVDEVIIFRITAGKVVEAWEVFDRLLVGHLVDRAVTAAGPCASGPSAGGTRRIAMAMWSEMVGPADLVKLADQHERATSRRSRRQWITTARGNISAIRPR